MGTSYILNLWQPKKSVAVMTEQYHKYDHLFSNVKPNAVGGIRIFTKDDPYRIEQDYAAVTTEENAIWRRLFKKLIQPLDQYASAEYLMGLKILNLPPDRFPNFRKLSEITHANSGWALQPVAGFLDEYVFFKMNAERKFPVTDIIRRSRRFKEKYQGVNIANEDGYTPEPDIYHDVRGHAPFLTDRRYGDFLADMGELGLELIRDERGLGPELMAHNLKRLQNFAWWTYEFGIMKKQPDSDALRQTPNDMDHEIYGAGILSSYNETMNVVACSRGESARSELKPFDMEEIVLTRFDYSEIQDRYYVIDSMESLYRTYYDHKDLFRFAG